MIGLRRLVVTCLLFAGCNTCLDVSKVPFSTSSDVGLDTQIGEDAIGSDDATVLPDGARPDQCEVIDWCAAAGVECGDFEPDDACAPSIVSCGTCGEGASCAAGQCECIDGYVATAGGCADVDECADGLDDCGDDEFCINEPGTFRCSDCPAGKEMGQSGCVDVDECARDLDNCDPLVSCTNLDPGFECGPCPNGYNDVAGDGTACVDIDECADGTHACDADATCTNEPGTYGCACNVGYVGDGFTCQLAPLVTSVTRVSLSITGTETSITAALPAGIDLDRAVPFSMSRSQGTNEHADEILVDVRIDPNMAELVVERSVAGGRVEIDVDIVEFAPYVTVQSGQFSSLDSLHTEMITTVDPATSFLTFSYRYSNFLMDRRRTSVSGRLSADEIVFTRGQAGGLISGSYYVVSSPYGLSVAHHSFTFNTTACGAEGIAAVAPARSFALYSVAVASTFAVDRAEDGNVNCELSLSTQAVCCRGDADFSSAVRVELQMLQFEDGSNAAVQRGASLMSGRSVSTTLVPAVDPLFTSVHVGPAGPGGVSVVLDRIDEEGTGMTTGELVNGGADLRLERGGSALETDETEPHWNVVTWPH